MTTKLTGTVALVTGASSGLGEATVRRLAHEGAKLVLGAEELSLGDEAVVQTDVTDRGQVEHLVKRAVQTHGCVDVVINNAGLMPLSPLEALKVEDWDRTIDVNLKGVLYGIAAALPHMKEQQGGHIINVSSVAGHKVSPGGAVATELPASVTEPDVAEGVHALYESVAVPADSFANMVAFTMSQPGDVDVNEILYRPTAQEL